MKEEHEENAGVTGTMMIGGRGRRGIQIAKEPEMKKTKERNTQWGFRSR